jgi:NitT/TauT family transport system ATP-binding protein
VSSIAINRVSKTFQTTNLEEVEALSDVSLLVQENQFVSIVGPSGCGKSTLLRLIAGLTPTTAGEIRISGAVVAAPREETGMVFQQPTLMPWRNVIRNVTFPLQLMGRLDRNGQEEAMKLLRLVGLSGFENRFPHELSGGMQQRAAICRALVHDPVILLMDEPFGALDALTREEMSIELLRIWTERPKTIVFVTHSIPEAVLLSDRVVVLSPRPGRIVEVIDIPMPRPRTLDIEASDVFQGRVQPIRHLIGNRKTPMQAEAAPG